ncbi:MAG: transketolase family protein [Candidatus Limnocylindrales bacterium]
MTMPMGRPMREIFGETVAELADSDRRIVMLDGDLGTSTRGDIFEAAHPGRYLQMGIAEQNMMGVAAGLATMGLIPFISTFAAFAAVRPLDQVRVLIAQTGLPVKITAGYSGLLTGKSGKTHQIVDDVAIMRAMPGMVVVSPADDIEAAQVLRWCVGFDGPVYIRLTRDASARCFDEAYAFVLGRAITLRDGGDVTLMSTGAQTPRVLEAAETLAASGIAVMVVHVPTLKPLDVPAIVAAAERTGRVITVEEHTVIGGLGGAIAETLSEHRPTRVQRIGLQDTFTESGPNEGLLDLYGLSASRVAEQVARLLERVT